MGQKEDMIATSLSAIFPGEWRFFRNFSFDETLEKLDNSEIKIKNYLLSAIAFDDQGKRLSKHFAVYICLDSCVHCGSDQIIEVPYDTSIFILCQSCRRYWRK